MVESGHTQRNFRNATPIGSVNLNQLVIQLEARRMREAKAQAAKCQAESTQEADARRKRVAKAQAAKWQAESTLEADARRKKGAEARSSHRK